MVVDQGVNVVAADPAATDLFAAAVRTPCATARDLAELLAVQVDQLARDGRVRSGSAVKGWCELPPCARIESVPKITMMLAKLMRNGKDEQMPGNRVRAIIRAALRDLAETKEIVASSRQAQDHLCAEVRELQGDIRRLQEDIRRLPTDVVVQEEVSAVNFAAFDRYQDALQGRDVVIVAPGATLTHYSPIKGAVHIGVNKVISDLRIPLDFCFAQDFSVHGRAPGSGAPFATDRADCTYFFGVLAHGQRYLQMEASQSLTAHLGATRYFVDASPSSAIEYDIRFNPLADFFTVVFPALHFALFTNPRRIYLAGCDTTYFGYADGSQQAWTSEEVRSQMTHRIDGYRRMRDFAAHVFPETEIISLNPVTLAGLFSDQVTPGAEYRTSPAQPALAASDFSLEAIAAYVGAHIDEIHA